jgi:hypothetical protein
LQAHAEVLGPNWKWSFDIPIMQQLQLAEVWAVVNAVAPVNYVSLDSILASGEVNVY